MHGKGRTKESEYLLQLREKQKARFSYGVLEKQFRRYYEEANRLQGKTGDNLLQILESRLDNVVYRAGFARTRRQARQFVVHGHFLVNGHKVDIPSYRVSAHDIIDLAPKLRETTPHIVARETHGERDGPGLAAGPPRARPRPGPPAADPSADRDGRPGAADRRALLQVAPHPRRPAGTGPSPSGAGRASRALGQRDLRRRTRRGHRAFK